MNLIFLYFIIFNYRIITFQGFPGGSDGKESACNAEDLGLIPGLGRSPGESTGYPIQYSDLENFMDRGVWQVIVQGITESYNTVMVFAIHQHESGLNIHIYPPS